MKSFIFLFVGVVLLVVGIIVFAALGASPVNVHYEGPPVDTGVVMSIVRYGVSGLLGGFGLLFLILGLKGISRGSKDKKEKLHILQTGMDTEGTVTYVDKNYSLLINNNPIFSIVEYNYQDKEGNTFTRRIDNISSELVIRNRIQVGAKVPVKYAAEDHSKSVMLLQGTVANQKKSARCPYCGTRYPADGHQKCTNCGANPEESLL